MNRTVVISSNTAWSLFNYRAGLIRKLIADGYQVVAVAPEDGYGTRVAALGCRFVHLGMDNHGTNPGRDLLLLTRYVRLLRAIRPAVYLGYTVKPNVYGSIAAHLLRIPVVNNIAGLGAAFVQRSLLTQVVQSLYKVSLRRSHRVFFQNSDDHEMFVRSGLVRADAADRLPGSGVDLARYVPRPPVPLAGRPFRFLLIARMLKSKGIVEYVAAARAMRGHFPQVRFQLLGFIEEGYDSAISRAQIRLWEQEGLVEYLGSTDDVIPYIEAADCVVLPTFYREGVPRALLEAAAVARPLIATDTVGCRDVVDDGINGFLCQPRDAADLADKMTRMACLSEDARLAMGRAARSKIEVEFDEKLVLNKYADTVREVAARPLRRRAPADGLHAASDGRRG